MNATIELIKAKQNAIKAEKDLQEAKARAAKEARVRTFAPLREILMDALDLPAKSHSSRSRPFVKDHIALCDDQCVQFWEFHFGNYGFCIQALEDGAFEVTRGRHTKSVRSHLEEAKDALVAYLAEIVAV